MYLRVLRAVAAVAAKTASIADAYWFAHHQNKDGWTHELDLRPAVEKW